MCKLCKTLLSASPLALLVSATAAAAAGSATISIALRPDKVKKHSTVSVSSSGFPTEGSMPTSAELQVQKGFKTNVKSVSQLCDPHQSSCPSASKIGSGTAQVTGTYLGMSAQDTVNFTLYLGKPKQAGDIASVVISGSDTRYDYAARGSGRLFKNSAGGLELLFDQFPTAQGLPPGVSITLNSLNFTAGATHIVKRHHGKKTYSLITNPSTCNGHWTGSGSVTFANGQTASQDFNTPCK